VREGWEMARTIQEITEDMGRTKMEQKLLAEDIRYQVRAIREAQRDIDGCKRGIAKQGAKLLRLEKELAKAQNARKKAKK
jgi:hypothetical protein